jgi:hypothetical protein
VHQPRFADAGLAQHGDHPPGPLGDDGGEGVLQRPQLLRPADRLGHDPLDAAGLRPEPDPVDGGHQVAVHRLVEALQP